MLKVWLPLTGDLHNQGISDVTATGHSVTSAATGKIGSCYQFTTSAIELNDKIFNNSVTEFTVTAWMKFNNSNSACLFSDRTEINSTGITLFIMDSGKIYYDVGARWEFTPSTAIPRNQWFHIAFLYKKGVLRQVYLNGALIGSTTSAPAPTSTSTSHSFIGASQNSSTALGGNYFNGWMNDVRIYDHCLSTAEVKEIAQGLILHYKLDGGMFGNPNLLTNTEKLDANVTKPSGVTITAEGYQNFTTATYDNTSGSSYHELLNWSGKVTVAANEIYTASFYAKSPISATLTTYFYNNTSGIVQNQLAKSSTGTTSTSADGGINVTLTPNWQQYWITWTFNSVTTAAAKTLLFRLQKGQGETSICGIKLEKGSAATPWCPADSELEIDRTIIEDSSGYNYNGTLTGAAAVTSETPRYNVSMHFSATNQYIRASTLTTSGFGSTYTFAWWEKRATYSGTMAWGFQNGIRLNGLYNGNLWNTGDSGNNPLYKPGTTTTVTVPTTNVWHHFAMVADGSTCKVYQDGELWAQAKTFKQISGTNLYINGWDTGTSYKNSNMSISDFRLYCTPLLDTDIKQLYNVSMKVDKSQNIHTYELYQKDENKLYKTGVLSNSSFNEINNLFNLLYDKQLYIEPDGSCWIRIFHHANCDTKLFASSDTFTTSVYKDADRWFNVSLCNKVNKWELMVKSMPATSGTETKYRWIQTKNPMTAAYADVAAASVTKVAGNGYASYGWGGLYHIGSNTYLATNNGTNGNWWGAVGAWAHHQGGIPGWTTVITTGYEDVYLRIDNLDQVNLYVKNIKAGMWTANQFIEK